MRLPLLFLAFLVVAARSMPAADNEAPKPAEAPKASSAESALKAEITAAQSEYAEAFNKGDAKAMSMLFTSDADWIDDQGTVIRGRAAIQRALEDLMGGQKDRTFKLRLDSVRSLGTDVVVGNSLATVTGGDRPSDSGTYIAVYVKQDGKWRITVLTESNGIEDDE